MGIAADLVRPYWMLGLNAVSGPVHGSVGDWLRRKEYQVYTPIATDSFTLSVADSRLLLAAFAGDCSRLAAAAVESCLEIDQPTHSPSATAWIVIRAYYSAYYAANVILRMLGSSSSQLDTEHTRSVLSIASLFGQAPVQSIQSGTYECVYDGPSATLRCMRQNQTGLGAHETFWLIFLRRIRLLSDQMLTPQGSSASAQGVAEKLVSLTDNLCFQGRNGGNWLSYIRNQVTYRQAFGAWFPYRGGKRRAPLLRILGAWLGDPMRIELRAYADRELERYFATCAFVVCLAHDMVRDMAARCPIGRSFLDFSPLEYMNRVQRSAKN
jgi:hypothetical protein